MTHLEITDLLNKEIAPLWPKWEMSPALIDLYTETFQEYEQDDVRKAFRHHKAERDYLEPKIPHVINILKKTIGERKAEERKNRPVDQLPCLAYSIVRMDQDGRYDKVYTFYSNWCCGDPEAMQRVFGKDAEAMRLRVEQLYGGTARVVFGTEKDIADIKERIRIAVCQENTTANRRDAAIQPKSSQNAGCDAGTVTSEVPW